MRRAAGSAGDGTGIMAGTLLSKMRASICSPKASRQVLAKAVLHRAAAREAAGLKTKTGPEAGTILAEDQAMIYKRGSVYWTKFQHSGRMIYKSTGQTSATKARQVEARLRSELAMGNFGILQKKVIPTLGDFLKQRVEPWARARSAWPWYWAGIRPLLESKSIAGLALNEVTSEVAAGYA